MSHACQILTFETDDKCKIQRECDEWGSYNCDPYERGGFGGGLGFNVQFTSLVFNDYEEAEHYLEGTFGDYRQKAVRYYKYPKRTKTSVEQRLEEKVGKTIKTLRELEDKPHYKGVKTKYITCAKCGSKLATDYCGKTWYNTCPVCRADVRPATVLERRDSLKKTLSDAQRDLKAETKKADEKNKSKAKLCWAVACEVHC